jgi:protein ImuB
MAKRFVSIWFRYLTTDWFTIGRPELKDKAFVLTTAMHGRMIVTAANNLAEAKGVYRRMVVADARAIIPGLEVVDDKPGLAEKLLKRIAEWCIRFTPFVSIDLPDGLILDVSGCSHLWGGDEPYLQEITKRLNARGYIVRAAIADTIGAAWAVARFGKQGLIVDEGKQREALFALPPCALRLDIEIIERLNKLGLLQIKSLLSMPGSALRRRFGNHIILRINQALGVEEEIVEPVEPVVAYHERLPCLEPIVTATGIEIALTRVLETLCTRLQQEEKGLRTAHFKCYRVDGKVEQIGIATNRASSNISHLFKLFEIKISSIEPALGIELFVLEAPVVEDQAPVQNNLWKATPGLYDIALAELLDRVAGKLGAKSINRFVPDEHYWPERSVKAAGSLHQQKTTEWKVDRPRPIQLLDEPEHIDVMAIVPDHPPVQFRYKGKMHRVTKADGPERIEQEWWIQEGQHRDYYAVEDEQGCRYWLFRSGHYDEDYEWFVHGYFA